MRLLVTEPWPVFDHLVRLTDRRGLFEHAAYGSPRREHGYCVDDVARALVVTCREPASTAEHNRLCRLYLDFTLSALVDDGSSHNRMNVEGRWTDEPSVGDWWGRALWGLGVAAAHAPDEIMRAEALVGFRRAAATRSPHLRATAFAALGAGEVAASQPAESSARDLLLEFVRRIGPPRNDPSWPWPEPRLSYGNGAIVEAMLLAGTALDRPDVTAHALQLLSFLHRTESFDGHLSVTPVGGRGPRDATPRFDQQPIEIAALADACARAFTITGDRQWLVVLHRCWAWFLGDNDSGTRMFDPSTGGGFDGLEKDGANLNQGAESTLALLSTAQQVRRLHGGE